MTFAYIVGIVLESSVRLIRYLYIIPVGGGLVNINRYCYRVLKVSTSDALISLALEYSLILTSNMALKEKQLGQGTAQQVRPELLLNTQYRVLSPRS